MNDANNFFKFGRSNTNSFYNENINLTQKSLFCSNKDKSSSKVSSPYKTTMKSEKKIANFRERIPQLLDQIKTKNSSRQNNFIDNLNNSNGYNSNSSEINDDNDSYSNNINKNNSISPKKYQKMILGKNEEINEYNKMKAPITHRQSRNVEYIEYSPSIKYRKFSKDTKNTLVPRLHKYFFQDGEMENIETLIKYNINKIKINKNYNKEENNNQNIDFNNVDDIIGNFDYYNIRQQVIKLMEKFADAFDKENKNKLFSAIKDLSDFSAKYKFEYVTQLTCDWMKKLKEKKYENCELKYIGYYNQIRDIMDKMLKELKKQADSIIFSQNNNIKDNIIENENGINNEKNLQVSNININKNLLKKNSINKEDLLKTKEIVPIKIDIEVKNSLNINEVEEIIKNLEEGNLGNLCYKENINNNKKLLNKNINRNQNEMEAYCYPFKEDNICYIF